MQCCAECFTVQRVATYHVRPQQHHLLLEEHRGEQGEQLKGTSEWHARNMEEATVSYSEAIRMEASKPP